MLAEQHFSDRSNYPKASDTATPIDDVEWFAKNVGITNLDDPSVKVRTIIDDVNKSELARHEAKKAREAKAKDEFLDAMFNLDSGTAVLRQKKERTKPAAKQLKVAKKTAKPAKKVAKVATASIKKEPSFYQLAKIRRDGFIADLQAGKMVKMVPQCKKNNQFKDYQTQHTDLMYIRRRTCFELLRLNRIKTGESFFIFDNFARHESVKVSGNLDGDDRDLLVKAVSSGKLFDVSNVDKKKACSGSVAQLARRHGIDIYTVFIGRKLIGWITLDEIEVALTAEQKRNKKAAELGGMLQAIDYLRIEKEVAARMPTSTPDEILEAAYREFKRVAKDAGASVSEVLAVKDGQ